MNTLLYIKEHFNSKYCVNAMIAEGVNSSIMRDLFVFNMLGNEG